jgi:hypothetical protein
LIQAQQNPGGRDRTACRNALSNGNRDLQVRPQNTCDKPKIHVVNDCGLCVARNVIALKPEIKFSRKILLLYVETWPVDNFFGGRRSRLRRGACRTVIGIPGTDVRLRYAADPVERAAPPVAPKTSDPHAQWQGAFLFQQSRSRSRRTQAYKSRDRTAEQPGLRGSRGYTRWQIPGRGVVKRDAPGWRHVR